jgi:hypothetical protein
MGNFATKPRTEFGGKKIEGKKEKSVGKKRLIFFL